MKRVVLLVALDVPDTMHEDALVAAVERRLVGGAVPFIERDHLHVDRYLVPVLTNHVKAYRRNNEASLDYLYAVRVAGGAADALVRWTETVGR